MRELPIQYTTIHLQSHSLHAYKHTVPSASAFIAWVYKYGRAIISKTTTKQNYLNDYHYYFLLWFHSNERRKRTGQRGESLNRRVSFSSFIYLQRVDSAGLAAAAAAAGAVNAVECITATTSHSSMIAVQLDMFLSEFVCVSFAQSLHLWLCVPLMSMKIVIVALFCPFCDYYYYYYDACSTTLASGQPIVSKMPLDWALGEWMARRCPFENRNFKWKRKKEKRIEWFVFAGQFEGRYAR